MHNNPAIPLAVPRERKSYEPDDDEEKTKRSSRAPIPEWWLEYAEKYYQVADTTLTSLSKLGDRLATTETFKKLNRPDPWSHSTLSRFFAGRATREIADALLESFVGLSSYVYYPRDPAEAMRFESVAREADERLRSSRRAHVEAVERRAGVGKKARPDQARNVHSTNAASTSTDGGGASGRRARGVESSGQGSRRSRP